MIAETCRSIHKSSRMDYFQCHAAGPLTRLAYCARRCAKPYLGKELHSMHARQRTGKLFDTLYTTNLDH